VVTRYEEGEAKQGFFFEKKNQKTSAALVHAEPAAFGAEAR
jgi:hypothetical protein